MFVCLSGDILNDAVLVGQMQFEQVPEFSGKVSYLTSTASCDIYLYYIK